MKSKKILVVCDIDGTILNTNHQLDEETIKTFNEIQNNLPNVYLCLVTGRNWWETEDIYKQLKLNTVAICCNGCEIVNYSDPQFQSRFFTYHKKVIKNILRDQVFVNGIDWVIITTINAVYSLNSSKDIHNFLENIYESCHHEIVYLRAKFKSKKQINYMFSYVKVIAPNLLIQCWEYENKEIFFMEIGVPYATKKLGVEFLASYYNVDYSNIYIFGDNINDLSMLSMSCNTYALSSGVNQAKICAKKITEKNNDCCGVAYELKKIFNLS